MLSDDHEDSNEWIRCFVRLYGWSIVTLVYYIGEIGAMNVPNTVAVVVYFWGMWYIFTVVTAGNLNNDSCVDGLVDTIYKVVMLGLPTTSLIALLLERFLVNRYSSSATRENQNLL